MVKVDKISSGIEGIAQDISLEINPGDRIGLVGPNGAGKSTLLKMITGAIEPQSGTIHADNVLLGLVPQNMSDFNNLTIEEYLKRSTGIQSIEDAHEKALRDYSSDPSPSNLQLMCDAADNLGRYGVSEFISIGNRALFNAGISYIDWGREIGSLSGGQRSRVGLAAIIGAVYDVVILDEPTNNLDIAGIETLEGHIANGKDGAFLIATHDRRLLRSVATSIIEMTPGKKGVRKYGLGYDEFLLAKQRDQDDALRLYEESQTAIDSAQNSMLTLKSRSKSAARPNRSTDKDKIGANFRSEKASRGLARQASSAESRLLRMRRDAPPKPDKIVGLDFEISAEDNDSRCLINVSGIMIDHPGGSEHQDIGPFGFSIDTGDRILIAGPNGSGKSTLLKYLNEQIDTTESERISPETYISQQLRACYIDQNQTLPIPDRDPIENMLVLNPNLNEGEVMGILAKFNLKPELVKNRPSSTLSGGERMRVLLASASIRRANLLILDEPTNNLDIVAIEALQKAISEYPGAVMLVSHDRDFIEAFGANKTITLPVQVL